jgi:hypothetical protein
MQRDAKHVTVPLRFIKIAQQSSYPASELLLLVPASFLLSSLSFSPSPPCLLLSLLLSPICSLLFSLLVPCYSSFSIIPFPLLTFTATRVWVGRQGRLLIVHQSQIAQHAEIIWRNSEVLCVLGSCVEGTGMAGKLMVW